MQIELNNIDPNINRIIAYSDDYFKLANKVIHSNLVISKDNLRIPQSTYTIEKESFGHFLKDAQNFIKLKNMNKLNIFKTKP